MYRLTDDHRQVVATCPLGQLRNYTDFSDEELDRAASLEPGMTLRLDANVHLTRIDDLTDVAKAAIGAAIAQVFMLRHHLVERDRYPTTWGTKTDIGIYAVAKRLLAGESPDPLA